MIEQDVEKPGAEQLRKDVVQWLTDIGVYGELEEKEAALISTPLGQLEKRDRIDASWSAEGMVVLSWAVAHSSLPAFYMQCDPSEVANEMGFLAERASTVLRPTSSELDRSLRCRGNLPDAALEAQTILARSDGDGFRRIRS